MVTNTTETRTAGLPRDHSWADRCLAGRPRRPARFPNLALAVLAGVLALTAFTAPAAAQTVTLVSNVGQTRVEAVSTVDRAQGFTAGNNPGGYTLSSVDIISVDAEGDDATVSVCTTDASGFPTTTCTALTAPGSFAAGTLAFTAFPSMTLAKETTYTVVIGTPGGDNLELGTTALDGEDSAAAAGWSLADAYHFKNTSNNWQAAAIGYSLQITVKGTIVTGTNTAPTAADFNFSDTDTGDALESVKITSLPASAGPILEQHPGAGSTFAS